MKKLMPTKAASEIENALTCISLGRCAIAFTGSYTLNLFKVPMSPHLTKKLAPCKSLTHKNALTSSSNLTSLSSKARVQTQSFELKRKLKYTQI